MNAPAFKRVLVPIDFAEDNSEMEGERIEVDGHHFCISKASIKALTQARALAKADGDASSELRLLHATPSYDQARLYRGKATASALGGALEQIHEEERQSSLAVLAAIAERWCQGVKHSDTTRAGTALNVILQEAREYDADLIVMPTSSRGVVARFFLGSTADRVIREAQCPVLIIPS